MSTRRRIQDRPLRVLPNDDGLLMARDARLQNGQGRYELKILAVIFWLMIGLLIFCGVVVVIFFLWWAR